MICFDNLFDLPTFFFKFRVLFLTKIRRFSISLHDNSIKYISYNLGMMLNCVRRLATPVLCRNASTLILVEHDGNAVNAATLNTVTAAKKLGGPIHALVAGDSCQGAAGAAARIEGVEKVLVAEGPGLKGQLAEAVSAVLLDVQAKNNYSHILANGTVFGKVSLFVDVFYLKVCTVHV